MRKIIIASLLGISLVTSIQTKAQKQKAIIHANVVNVVTGKIDPDQTVLIDSNRIVAVGSSKKVKVPATASVIDAGNKYLMPGMIDAHIHFFQSGGLYTRPDGINLNAVYSYDKDQQWIKNNLNGLMKRYLAAGITTVVDVGGPFSNYDIRKNLEQNAEAPTAWVTGPLISTYLPPNLDKKDPPIVKVTNEEEARALVRRQVPYKPDFIKIWYIALTKGSAVSNLPIIKATIDESHANGLKVAVHATEYETAKLAIENGADILVHSIDDKEIDKEMLELLKSKKTVYIPTAIVAQNYNRTFSQQLNYTQYDLKIADPFMIGTIMDIQHIEKSKMPFDYTKMKSRFPVPSKDDSTILTNLKIAQQSGVLVAAGTDAGNIGTQHASSYFAELMAMSQAGLSNWEVLKSATINVAKGFGKEKESGSIESGKIADMVMLDKNPVENINALSLIHTVIHRGNLLDPLKLLPNSPEILVQQQLNAYNLRNMEAFLEPYSDSVELYNFPNQLMSKGKEEMRKGYTDMFKNITSLHCQVTERMVQGNTVIDHETVMGFGAKPLKAIAIYKIEKGKIAKVYFIQ